MTKTNKANYKVGGWVYAVISFGALATYGAFQASDKAGWFMFWMWMGLVLLSVIGSLHKEKSL